ncbi:MAG: DUF6398 domain-containing protein [Oscillospiraceae bacterium]|nr:DUF6398 domain-containing protein [Oscillospiraceae bacterium]
MYLDVQDKDLFYKLYFDLLHCTNKKHKIVKRFGDGRFPTGVDSRDAYQIREALFDNPKWIDEYIHGYGSELTEEELGILASWRDNFIKERFFVVKHLAKYSVFMTTGDENTTKLYGITGLNHPFADLFDRSLLPIAVAALILPFKGKIIYDGLVSAYNIRIGPNMRRSMNEAYRISKEKFGIIDSLPFDDSAPREVRKAVPKKTVERTLQQKDERFQEIAEAITGFCEAELNSEFTEVCLHVLEKLRRKRPTPLTGGKTNTWACGIVYAVCSNNFVFDRSQPYYMSAQDIADGFGLSKSTAQSKAAEINKALKITYFVPEFVIASNQGHTNSLLDMVRAAEDLRRLLK